MKKMRFFPQTFLLLAMLLTIVSCSKEAELTGNDQPAPALSVVLDYEDIGQRHNAILDAIGYAPDFSAANASGDISDLAAYFAKIIKTTTECVDCNESQVAAEAAAGLGAVAAFENVADAADHYFAQGGLNAEDKLQLHALNDLIAASMGMSGSAVQSSLLAFEGAVAQNGNLSDDGRITILGSSAVMRYSDAYWRNARANVSNPWHEIEDDRNDTFSIIPWYIKDVLGALCQLQEEGPWGDIPKKERGAAVGRVIKAAACASFGG